MKYIDDLRNGIEDLIIKNNAYIIGEDIQEPYGGAFKVTKGLSSKYPNNIIATPMSEQGFTGLGIGMALLGCFVSTEIMFGDFITLTADQMINHAAKFRELYQQALHFVVRCPSGAYRGYGATHSQSLEKMFLGMPGIQVISPNIACAPGGLLRKSMESGIPTFFVENKLDYPRELLGDRGLFWIKEVHIDSDGFPLIQLKPLDEKPDIYIITYGGLTNMAMQAMENLLYEYEINAEIVIPTVLSDTSFIMDRIEDLPVVILEEGVQPFGWGAEVACSIYEKHKSKIHRVGAKNSFIPSAKNAEFSVLPSLNEIIDSVREAIK